MTVLSVKWKTNALLTGKRQNISLFVRVVLLPKIELFFCTTAEWALYVLIVVFFFPLYSNLLNSRLKDEQTNGRHKINSVKLKYL